LHRTLERNRVLPFYVGETGGCVVQSYR
jgi:hypothetical protein